MKRPHRTREGGSTLVESALLLLAFVALLTGIFDVGQGMFFHHVVAGRARTGVRYAAVHSYDPAVIRNFVVYNTATPSQASQALFGLSPSQVTVARYEAGTVRDRIEVRVDSYALSFASPVLPRRLIARPFRAIFPVESLGVAQ